MHQTYHRPKKSTPCERNNMRASPEWWQSIPIMIETIEADTISTWYASDELERLLRLSRSSAVRLMKWFGAIRVGMGRGILLIERNVLLENLKRIHADTRHRVEQDERRRERIAALRPVPSRVIKEYNTPQVAIASRTVQELPSSIRFEKGVCRIEAADGQTLMEQLLAIAGTLNRGLDGFDLIDALLKGEA